MKDRNLVCRDGRICPGGQVAVQAPSSLFASFLDGEPGESRHEPPQVRAKHPADNAESDPFVLARTLQPRLHQRMIAQDGHRFDGFRSDPHVRLSELCCGCRIVFRPRREGTVSAMERCPILIDWTPSGHPRGKRGVRRFRPRRHLFQGDGQARDPRLFIEVWVCHFTDALPQPLGDHAVEHRHLLLDAPPFRPCLSREEPLVRPWAP